MSYKFTKLSFKKYYNEPEVVGDVELTIDWQKLARELGARACFNKSHKSSLGVGISAKFIPVKGAS